MGVVKFSLIAVLIAVLLYFLLNSTNNFEPESIRGKRVLITGASSGIGEELAYQYSKLGASVLITARREGHLQKVAAKCKQLGAKQIEYVAADMALTEHRERVVKETEKRLGGLDHLILNHAIFNFEPWQYTSTNLTTLKNMMEINFYAFIDITSRSLKMLKESQGNIGVVSSIAGKLPGALLTYYSPAKFALQAFFGAIRQELIISNANVSVTVFPLGFVKTEMAIHLHKTMIDAKVSARRISLHVEVDETATRIIRGVTLRENEVFYPEHLWYVSALCHWLPLELYNKMYVSFLKKSLIVLNP